MTVSRRSTALVLAVVALLALAGWAFRGEVGPLLAGASADTYPGPGPYPGPYPAQFLPAVLLLATPSPVAPPQATLHVGLQLRWDGSGYILFEGYSWRPGTHETRAVDEQVDGDTVRVAGQLWYSPNPLDFESDSWYCHYNTATNRAEMCSGEDDPSWKWGYTWILPAGTALANGQRLTIDGQSFDISGPHTFLTGYGEEAAFWRLRNRDRFLFFDDGGQWTQYVEAGDVSLYYDIDNGILLYDNIKRTFYKNGASTSSYVQYEALISRQDGRLSLPADLRAPSPNGPDAGAPSVEALDALLAAAGLDARQLGPGPGPVDR